ncbi:MAG: FHA domain-containing protein [Pirellulales bacterium]|nr:FHA domain-containing protein [Pirellulales bacterium]
MDVILKVLEGAKNGAKVAVKKAEFTIGRSQECTLCAGSSAVSRQHCVILRSENRVAVKDLGSRNGTLVNGVKAEGEVELKSGDELIVGPLKFLVMITSGIANEKKPQVKSVAEAVERVATSNSGSLDVDDISGWLLGPASPAGAETQTMLMDDTNAGKLQSAVAEALANDSDESDVADEAEAEPDEGAEDGKKKKKEAGKLPKFSSQPQTKDSREAAMEALRNWNRRR